jgi:hypothetical protein
MSLWAWIGIGIGGVAGIYVGLLVISLGLELWGNHQRSSYHRHALQADYRIHQIASRASELMRSEASRFRGGGN